MHAEFTAVKTRKNAARHDGEMRMKNSGVTAVAREFNFKRFFILTEFSFGKLFTKVFLILHIARKNSLKLRNL